MFLDAALDALPPLEFDAAQGLPPQADDADPLALFAAWYHAAEGAGLVIPEAVALATADASGAPSVRMVLLKNLSEGGFVFFTNYESRKARELDENPRASLCFHWAALERQIRISGPVERISQEESLAYFRSRPRGSRLGAWASRQSRPLERREELEERVAEVEQRFGDDEVPRPPFWGGYRLRPEAMEFWQGQASRLHDRLVFRRRDHRAAGGPDGGPARGDVWNTRRLYP